MGPWAYACTMMDMKSQWPLLFHTHTIRHSNCPGCMDDMFCDLLQGAGSLLLCDGSASNQQIIVTWTCKSWEFEFYNSNKHKCML